MKNCFSKLFTLILMVSILEFGQAGVLKVASQTEANTIRVAPAGNDTVGCGSDESPCHTLQYAVNQAQSGDTILVAEGTYTYSANDQTSACFKGTTTVPVVCVVDKFLTILGGYQASNWNTADPVAHPTIIDGQNQHRGITLLGSNQTSMSAQLDLEGFTIRNGLAQGATTGSDDDTDAYGGGMFIDTAGFTLRNLIFQNNQAIGGNTSNSHGGVAAGGALEINKTPPNVSGVLENIAFENNQALGGTGAVRGGGGLGGGFHAWIVQMTATNLTFTDNLAQAGNSNGVGYDNTGLTADGLGGGFVIHGDGTYVTATLQHITATGNSAVGGNASGSGGGGHGGAMEVEQAPYVNLSDAVFSNNWAIGGSGQQGGIGSGGGILSVNGGLIIDRTQLVANHVVGGYGSVLKGSPGGGGLFVWRVSGSTTISIINSIIAGNTIEFGDGNGDPGGGGGGIWAQGVSLDITNSTISGNYMDPGLIYGLAAIFVNFGAPTPTVANISYSIISDHIDNHGYPSATQPALYNWLGNTVNFTGCIFANNTNDTNAEEGPPNYATVAGTFTGLNSVTNLPSVSYIAPGAPYYNYHVPVTSQLIDAAVGSTTPVDIDNRVRPDGYAPDVGADEYYPFSLSVVPGDGSLFLGWGQDAQVLEGGVSEYQILVTCAPGASPPREGRCGSPISVPADVTFFTLTGLSNFKDYTITVNANNAAGAQIASSIALTAFPSNIHAFLPLIVKK
jgi:hypothetical protein